MKPRSRFLILAPWILCLLVLFALGARKAPNDSGSQLAFGVEMAKRGLWSEALFRFKQADRKSPGNPRIHNNLAVAYEALGRFDKALTFYQSAIKSDPANKELKRNYSRFVEFYRAFKPDAPDENDGATEALAAEPNSSNGGAEPLPATAPSGSPR